MKKVLFGLLLLPAIAFSQAKKSAPAASSRAKSLLQSSVTAGNVVYNQFCLTCHQADGSGVPNMNPPLTRNRWTMGAKPVLIEQVLKGSSGKVEIDGETYHNTMPPLGQALTDQQVADVLTYVRASFGNKASKVTPAEVKIIRAKTK